MTTVAQPTWTDNVSIIAAGVVAAGASARGTIDLRGKVGAVIDARWGMTNTTAPGAATQFIARRLNNNGGAGARGAGIIVIGSPYVPATLARTTVGTDSNADQAVLNATSGSNFAAGNGIMIVGTDLASRLEFARVSKVATNTITLDAPLINTHTSVQGDYITNRAGSFQQWLSGGALWEVIFDYGITATGSDVLVQVIAQTYDYDAQATV